MCEVLQSDSLPLNLLLLPSPFLMVLTPKQSLIPFPHFLLILLFIYLFLSRFSCGHFK
jgi:hypothetical protein